MRKQKLDCQYPRIVIGSAATRRGMSSTLLRGDEVAVDVSARTIGRDGIYAIGTAIGCLKFVRAQRRRNGVWLKYDDKRYRAQFIPNDRLGDIPIFGRAMMIQRMLW
jgi:phage repressor protein C with HTH and peptisase S24 domain